jgi:hypothetical protein
MTLINLAWLLAGAGLGAAVALIVVNRITGPVIRESARHELLGQANNTRPHWVPAAANHPHPYPMAAESIEPAPTLPRREPGTSGIVLGDVERLARKPLPADLPPGALPAGLLYRHTSLPTSGQLATYEGYDELDDARNTDGDHDN